MFCLKIVEGCNYSDAYRAAYNTEQQKPETINRSGKKLIDDPKIKARIAEIAAPVLETVRLSAQTVLEDIMRITAKAEEADRYSDALRGCELLGKHLKLFTDKVEASGPDGAPLIGVIVTPSKNANS
jgi:hypothetical protein